MDFLENNDDRSSKIILREVCKFYGVDEIEIMKKSRERRIVEPRHLAMYFIKKHTRKSLAEIGRIFKKDHATVMHACRLIPNLMSVNGLGKDAERIEGHIRFHISQKETFPESWVRQIAQL